MLADRVIAARERTWEHGTEIDGERRSSTARSASPTSVRDPRQRRRSRPRATAARELWFSYHLGRKIREKLAASQDSKDRPVLD